MRQEQSDQQWRLHEAWLAYLDGYRLENHISTTWHYLADGPHIEPVGRVYKAMSRRRRAGATEWFAGAEEYFERQGHELAMKRSVFERSSNTLLAEGDLSLRVVRRDGSTGLAWPLEDLPALRSAGTALVALARGCPCLDDHDDEVRDWLHQLREAGVLARYQRPAPSEISDDYRLRSTGHAGVSIETPTTRVLVDPLFTCPYRTDIDELDELRRRPIDAVVLTQAAWDHFNIDTLLFVDRSIPVFIKRRERPPSLGSPDLEAFLRELGFTKIVALDLWQPTSIGDITLTALPFRGAGSDFDFAPDWMTVACEAGGRSIYITANACRDQRGSIDEIVREIGRALGGIDILVAGYLGYEYPVSWFTRHPFYLGPGRELATTASSDGVRWATMLGAEALLLYAGFAWTKEDLSRPPPRRYGGVVQRGTLAAVAADLKGWSRPLGFAPLPGGELRWHRGRPLQAVSCDGSALAPLSARGS